MGRSHRTAQATRNPALFGLQKGQGRVCPWSKSPSIAAASVLGLLLRRMSTYRVFPVLREETAHGYAMKEPDGGRAMGIWPKKA